MRRILSNHLRKTLHSEGFAPTSAPVALPSPLLQVSKHGHLGRDGVRRRATQGLSHRAGCGSHTSLVRTEFLTQLAGLDQPTGPFEGLGDRCRPHAAFPVVVRAGVARAGKVASRMSHAHSASLGIAVASREARCSKRGFRGARRDCPNERVVGRLRIPDAALRRVLAASPGPTWKRRLQAEPKEDLNSPAAGPVP